MTLSLDGTAKVAVADAANPAVPQRLFLTELESVRGLAALSVAIFHSAHIVPVDGKPFFFLKKFYQLDSGSEIVMRLLMTIFSGGAAVSMFFVLSGFVLMLSLMRD